MRIKNESGQILIESLFTVPIIALLTAVIVISFISMAKYISIRYHLYRLAICNTTEMPTFQCKEIFLKNINFITKYDKIKSLKATIINKKSTASLVIHFKNLLTKAKKTNHIFYNLFQLTIKEQVHLDLASQNNNINLSSNRSRNSRLRTSNL